MITEEMLYWIFRLNAIHAFCFVVLLVGGLVTTLITVHLIIDKDYIDFSDYFYKRLLIFVKSMYVIIGIAILTLIFLPSTKEMAAIKLIPVIYNSDFVQKELPKECKELYDFAKVAVKHTLIN